MTEQNGLERSSATERLRALLDERGVEWVAIGTDTCWTGADGYPMRAWETTNGTHMRVADLTPEQAIEATLGKGTCEILGYDDGYDDGLDDEMYQYADPRYFLSCEHEAYGSVAPNYCPRCGRKVVDA